MITSVKHLFDLIFFFILAIPAKKTSDQSKDKKLTIDSSGNVAVKIDNWKPFFMSKMWC